MAAENEVTPDLEEGAEQPAAPVDRGMPSLKSSSRSSTGEKMKWLAVAAVAVVVCGIGLNFGITKIVTAYKAHKAEQGKLAETRPNIGRLDTASVVDKPLLPASATSAGEALQNTAATTVATPPAPAVPPALPEGGRGYQAGAPSPGQPTPQAAADQAIANAPIFAFGGNTASHATTSPEPAAAVGDGAAMANLLSQQLSQGQSKDQPGPTTLASSLKGTSTPSQQAALIGDMNFVLPQGTLLHCTLKTAIDSTVPGMTSCVLSESVYSANGRVVLAERGSEITGQYETASLKSGMTRIFVLWTRLRTPYGVVVNLDSPATDTLGRSGISGAVNNHFWMRFGAGLLLSVVDDVTASALNRQGSGQLQLTSTTGEGKDAASIALAHSVDIPPTLSADQGTLVNVSVMSDINFGGVYGFRAASR